MGTDSNNHRSSLRSKLAVEKEGGIAMSKIATDLEQSKVLAKILPHESADMHHVLIDTCKDKYDIGIGKYIGILPSYPAWSLAALLENIPVYLTKEDKTLRLQIDMGLDDFDIWYEESGFAVSELDCISKDFVDACVEMIVKLNKEELL